MLGCLIIVGVFSVVVREVVVFGVNIDFICGIFDYLVIGLELWVLVLFGCVGLL